MENKGNTTWEYFGEEEEEEAEDTLSFCNLNIQEYKECSVLQSPRDSSAQDLFEFFSDERSPEFFSAPDVVFCGKLMHENRDDQLNEYQKRDYLTMVRSHSFRPSSRDEKDRSTATKSLVSRQISSSKSRVGSIYRVQNVNISGLTSMSKKSRRRMFMFGPVKFKPEMELSAIKERQGRRSTTSTTMSPPTQVKDGGKAVVRSGGKAAPAADKGKRSGTWNMVRSLRGKGHLTAVLARSFGCIPAAASVGKYLPVAN
ncbi:uncharacterized protein LOC113757064 [Coffea eugenioides]|uniref:uncharacterized protein LOC113756161 n=1 Tax=Coffea eugenioides TaxID=49369 RepID=UPI000F60D7F1|nr:uncharacterized protein LOC113756161 [Coffea eugenioides]XP_027156272.1 uncharacterized protein LOC113757064 [Coffea eugenioides]